MGTLNNINEMKKELSKTTGRGFGYFMKNIGMFLLIFLATFILTNPDLITNPSEFLEQFSVNSLWVVLALFITIAGFYQLSKSVQEDNRKLRDKENLEEYVEVLDKRKERERLNHSTLVEERFKVGPLISNELKNLLINLNADRAAILEMHNGTNNPSGLPFIYGDMVYEETTPNVGFASDEFKNFNIAKLPFVAIHYKEKTWIGSISEIEKDDQYLAAKLKVVNALYNSFIILEGINGPLGFLVVSFNDEHKHPGKAKIIAELNHSSQIISTLLDKTIEN